MPKYLCQLILEDQYELIVEADNLDDAILAAGDTDVSLWDWIKSNTEMFDVKEIKEEQ